MEIIEDYAQFTTITALNWKPILRDKNHKDIIINSLRYLAENKRIYLYAFVIMDNHFHVIWHMRPPHTLPMIKRDFLKFTAQHLKRNLQINQPEFLKEFEVNHADRKYQIWQRDSLSIPVFSPAIFDQKINYIHQNPVKAGLVDVPWNYYYSSGSFYFRGKSDFDFLTHHEGE
mgnify:CR=1 FL=1